MSCTHGKKPSNIFEHLKVKQNEKALTKNFGIQLFVILQ